MHPYLNHHFIMGGAATPPNPPRYLLDVLQRFNCTPIRIITSANIMGGLPPLLLFRFALSHDLLVMLGMLVGHAGDVENDAGDVDRLVENVSFARECCKTRHFGGPTENEQISPPSQKKTNTKTNPKINPPPFSMLAVGSKRGRA